MHEFEFQPGDFADRTIGPTGKPLGRWQIADVHMAIVAHLRERGERRTLELLNAYALGRNDAPVSSQSQFSGTRLARLPEQTFGVLIAALCRDMALRPHRRKTHA